MKGQIKISNHEARVRSYYYNLSDLFDERVNQMYLSKTAHPKIIWYAYRLDNGIHYFLWTNKPSKIKKKYLRKLMDNDWNISIEILETKRKNKYRR